jgi:hypothetical protein
MLCGTLEGLLSETNQNPAGALIYELLKRSGDPWGELLDPPKKPLDADAILTRFGERQAPLVPTRSERRAERQVSAAQNLDSVASVFAEMSCRGRERREPQIRFAELSEEALRSGRFAVVEAGTGMGKSLGYLVPAALRARAIEKPVVVSTHSKVLQNQLIEKDIKYLSELLPWLTAAVLKGRTNYLSIRRLREEITDALDEERISLARAWTLGTLASLAIASEDGDMEAALFAVENIERYLDAHGEALRVSDSVRANVSGNTDKPERVAGGRLDFYDAAKENAARADIVVLNHSLLLTQAVLAGDRLPDLLSPLVICDEAHNLEDAATSVLKHEVSEKGLRRLLRAVHDRGRRAGLLATVRKVGVAAGDEAMLAAQLALSDTGANFQNLSRRLHSFVEANTIQSREDLARYGSQVEIRPASLQAAGGPALRESAVALMEALYRLRPALEALEIESALQLGERGFPYVTLAGDFRRDNLVFRVFRPQSAGERDALAVSLAAQIVGDAERGGSGIIYVATRREAERLASLLRGRNVAAQPYHAGMATATRHHVQELFMQGEIQVVVATNAFGMGVDKQEIRFVLHYDHPSSVEAYVQESGRAGRDGREAYAILLYSPRTQRTHRFLAQQGVPSPTELELLAERLLKADFDGAVKMADGAVLTSLERMVEEFDIDEAKLRVMIHALEQKGVLKRGNDFALEATVLLNHSPAVVVAKLGASERTIFESLATEFKFAAEMRSHYRAIPFAYKRGISPNEIDRLLHRLAQQGGLIYRSFARGSSFTPGERASDRTAVSEAASTFQERFVQFTIRLRDIIRFAELSSAHGECRAAFLVDYLTGNTRRHSTRCGKCDLCAPQYPLPWSMAALVTPEPLQIEPTMAVLEVVRDHEAQYGVGTLKKILLGEAFGVQDGERYSLSAYARNSQHFGVLRGKSTHEKLQQHFDSLIASGHLSVVERQRPSGGTYRAVHLTDRGRDILAGAAPIPGNECPITVGEET